MGENVQEIVSEYCQDWYVSTKGTEETEEDRQSPTLTEQVGDSGTSARRKTKAGCRDKSGSAVVSQG